MSALTISFFSQSLAALDVINLKCDSTMKSIYQKTSPSFDLGIVGIIKDGNAAIAKITIRRWQTFQTITVKENKVINLYGVNYLVAEIKAGEWGTPDCGITLKRSGFSAPKK